MEDVYWTERLRDVLPGRAGKPRIGGLTMVIDTGLSVPAMRDIFQLAADYIDFWKFGFASSSVYPPERMMDKVTVCQEYGVQSFPGGTSLEIAYVQGVWRDYMESLYAAGIRVLEVSDGTIRLPLRTRREMIRAARKLGFTVLAEVGKKLPDSFLPIPEQVQMIHGDLNSGANYIIVEGRETGRSVGVYDAHGDARAEDVDALLDTLGPLATRLLWEAPLPKQQTFYINRLGNRVNLGNIAPADVIGLESLRRGFRSDTLRQAIGDAADNRVAHRQADDARDAGSATRSSEQTGVAGNRKSPGITLWTAGRANRSMGLPDGRRPNPASRDRL